VIELPASKMDSRSIDYCRGMECILTCIYRFIALKPGEALMFSIKKTAVCLILVLGLMAVPAWAGLLGTGSSYNDGLGPLGGAWGGTKHFDVAGTGGRLTGDLDWAVFTGANFSSLFTGYTPTLGELVYTYQIHNTGTLNISKGSLKLIGGAPADSADDFTGNGVSGQAPGSTQILSTDVIWNFQAPNNIDWNPAESSNGLVFSSIRRPRNDVYVVVDGGASTNITGVAGPGTNSIPEPSVLTLLLVAAATLCGIKIRRN
jgi:hypothetical protein